LLAVEHRISLGEGSCERCLIRKPWSEHQRDIVESRPLVSLNVDGKVGGTSNKICLQLRESLRWWNKPRSLEWSVHGAFWLPRLSLVFDAKTGSTVVEVPWNVGLFRPFRRFSMKVRRHSWKHTVLKTRKWSKLLAEVCREQRGKQRPGWTHSVWENNVLICSKCDTNACAKR